MNLSRRKLILAGLGGSLLAGGAAIVNRWIGPFFPLSDAKQRLITVIVDLLIPADASSPSGSGVGVDRELTAQANTEAGFRRLVSDGYRRLNELANTHGGPDFITLAETDQIRLLTQMEQAQPRTMEHRFFQAMRHRAFHSYYAKPAAWSGLCSAGPPQPYGHPDYSAPPRECGE